MGPQRQSPRRLHSSAITGISTGASRCTCNARGQNARVARSDNRVPEPKRRSANGAFGKYTGPEAEQGIPTSASSGRPVKQRCAVHVYGEKKCKSLSLGEQSGFELLSKPTPDYLVRRYQTASPFNFIACGCIQSTLCANEVLFGRNDSCARGRGRHRGPAAIPAEPSTS